MQIISRCTSISELTTTFQISTALKVKESIKVADILPCVVQLNLQAYQFPVAQVLELIQKLKELKIFTFTIEDVKGISYDLVYNDLETKLKNISAHWQLSQKGYWHAGYIVAVENIE